MTIVSGAGYLERDLRKWRAVLDSVDKMRAVMSGMLNVARVLDDVNRPMREMQRNWKLAQAALAQQELVTTYLVRPWVERQPCEDWLAEPEVDAEARPDEPDDLGYWPGYL